MKTIWIYPNKNIIPLIPAFVLIDIIMLEEIDSPSSNGLTIKQNLCSQENIYV